MIPNIGPLEIGIVLLIVVLIFGPKKLPELGKSIGHGLREFRGSVSGSHEEKDEPRAEVPETVETPAKPVRS